ncbi:MAG: primosomal protein N' [Phycisphaeraceae bacterium]|nr:primosomal protein N' [Phycisphaeraceae bacterium]
MTSLFAQPAPEPARPTATRFVRVVVERGIERAGREGGLIDSSLSYALPDGPEPEVGERVEVPLGRGNTRAAGIVVRTGGRELLDGLDPAKVKFVLARTGAGLPPNLVRLAEWIAGYYVCPLGMVFGTMVPAAVKRAVGRTTVAEVSLAPLSDSERARRLTELSPRLGAAWHRLLEQDAVELPATARAIVAAVEGVSSAAVKKLLNAGLLVSTERAGVQARALRSSAAGVPALAPTLTDEQAAVVHGLTPALGSFSAHVLRGVTGSGKTEVYLRLIDALFRRDPRATAIVLVPEIALTPQTSERFLARFPGRVAVLHSGLTGAQRHQQWRACADGSVSLVVGARSAIFAPLTGVGLIIVDEEHDGSYKQDQLPRYHARDVAVVRASLEGCTVVLGSATPSLESWINTRPHGSGPPKYRLWTLSRRATNAPLPRVDIVDLAEERRRRADQPGAAADRQLHLLGPTLEGALRRTLDDGGQAILLLNRRGYANYICCTDPRCGWTMRCDQCDATSVYHLHAQAADRGARGFVRCHHCLAEQLLPAKCPACGGRVNTFGLGTQRIEQELERKFIHTHGLRIGSTLIRVDGDTMRTANDYFEALDRFAAGQARVMLGTQMIAKGLDFPNVRLVGIVNADTALNLPDFRAAERTFQLVCQVAGRAGRADQPGRVVVQTMSPAEPAIVLASRHDYVGFAEGELAVRSRAALPPVGRMVRIVCRDEDVGAARASAGSIADALRRSAGRLAGEGGAVHVRGPFPCPISRIGGFHRVAIEVMAAPPLGRGTLQRLLAEVRSRGLVTSDARTAVDVDPIALL